MEPHAKMEQDAVEFLQDKGNLSVPFKKSLLQIIREVSLIVKTGSVCWVLLEAKKKKGNWRDCEEREET